MATDDLESRSSPPGRDDRGRPITSPRSFREAVADAAVRCRPDDDDGPDHSDRYADVTALTDYAWRLVGPRRRAEESVDAYAVRAFARLSEECAGRDDGARDRRSRGDWALYAGEAAESGRAEKAARWLWRLIADRPSDAAAWLLYAAFSARRRPADTTSALVCARKAVALDPGHRLALFALAAILMTVDDGGGDQDGELESTLRRALSARPRFAEAHYLAAVHSLRAAMPPDRTDRLLSLARRDDDDDGRSPAADAGHDDAARLLAALSAARLPTVRDGGDVAVGCAALLVQLGLVDLAAVCLRSFTARPDARPSYHYLMAVVHHGRGEFDASADHLAAVPDDGDDTSDGCRYLLAAHNDYSAGRTIQAMAGYAALLSSRPSGAHYGLAYSRLARHLAAQGRHAEAADAYFDACSATRTPALMTALAACLLAAARDGPTAVHDEPSMTAAERLLTEAVALDGDCDGDAWHALAAVHAACGRPVMADACRRQAVVLGFGSTVDA